jgi:hypothetical protein
MRRQSLLGLVAAAVLALAPQGAGAISIWDEGVNGDLSGNRLVPTDLGDLAAGSSTVTATSVAGDREYFTLVVPAGHQLDAIVLGSYTTSANSLSFVGLQSGATFTELPTGTNVANLLGWTHFGAAQVGTSILDDIGLGFGAQGFAPPLPAGAYTFWTQETGASPATYGLDFQVSLVPEPGTALLVALGLAGLAARRG